MVNYYLKNKPNLMKRFEYSLRIVKDLLMERFDESKSEDLINRMRKEYEEFLPKIPDVGGKKNLFISIITDKVSLLAMFFILEKEGYTYREIGQFAINFTEIETKNAIERAEKKGMNLLDFYFNDVFLNSAKAHCDDTLKRKYPDNWVMEYVDGTNEDFDYGLNVSECAIHKIYKKLGAEKYAPFGCLIDFAQANVLGYGLTRTESLANGALGCDHLFTRTGNTPKAWPPENFEEYTGKFE
ncbi:MAG: L-2-amino-thiazoline-4-carboxylic acid hydrolase [Candidatus Hermodarchaeota archaeon]